MGVQEDGGEYLSYELDYTYKKAAAAADVARRRCIGWDEQEVFFARHARQFGGLEKMCLERARLGGEKYGDNIFWYPASVLEEMISEEIADARVYMAVLEHRREVIGTFADLLDDRNEPPHPGAEDVCDTCALQEYIESDGKLICKSLQGCIVK